MSNNRIILFLENGKQIENPEIPGLKVDFLGKNSYVHIEEGANFENCVFRLNDNCSILVEKTQPRGLKKTVVNMAGAINSHFEIRKYCSIESCQFFLTNEEGSIIKIGEDCLFSSGIVFRANDGHVIYDINSGEVINYPKEILIGNHVWVGADVTVMKGSIIPDNTIIGQGSMVSKIFEEPFSVVAGNPAKVVRQKVNWDRRHIKNLKNGEYLHNNFRSIEIDNIEKDVKELYSLWDFDKITHIYSKYYKFNDLLEYKYIKHLIDMGDIKSFIAIFKSMDSTRLRNLLKRDKAIRDVFDSLSIDGQRKEPYYSLVYSEKNVSEDLNQQIITTDFFHDKKNDITGAVVLHYLVNNLLERRDLKKETCMFVLDILYREKSISETRKKVIIKNFLDYFIVKNKRGFFTLPSNYSVKETRYLLQLQSIAYRYSSHEYGAEEFLRKASSFVRTVNSLGSCNPKNIKVAVCISGMYRVNNLALDTIIKNVIQPLNADVFFHTWRNWQKWPGMTGSNDYLYRLFGQDVKDKAPNNLKSLTGFKKYFPRTSEKIINPIYEVFDESMLPYELNVKSLVIEKEEDFISKYKLDDKFKARGNFNQAKMFYGIYRAFQLLEDFELNNNTHYDIVIRCRPDFAIQNKVNIDVINSLKDDEIALDFLDYGPNDQVYAAKRQKYQELSYLWKEMVNKGSLVPIDEYKGYYGHSLMYLWMTHINLKPTPINLSRNVALVTKKGSLPSISKEVSLDFLDKANSIKDDPHTKLFIESLISMSESNEKFNS